jgi:hypothetical protein
VIILLLLNLMRAIHVYMNLMRAIHVHNAIHHFHMVKIFVLIARDIMNRLSVPIVVVIMLMMNVGAENKNK